MDYFSAAGILAIVQIILIDILLAGDNAIVIGMAARNLPAHLQKKAIFWGTFGAIALRLIMAFLFVEAINNIPALRLVGGLLLLWIGYKLVAGDDSEHNVEAKDNLRAAITTIVIADGIMGIDNVLAIAGVAHGDMVLVLLGLAISIPIVVWGSQIISNLMDRLPILITLGSAILAYTSASMILHDKIIGNFLLSLTEYMNYILPVLFIGAIIVYSQKVAKK